MALYQESFKLVNGAALDFIEINAALEKRTGLKSDVELLDDSTAVFSNKDLGTEVETQVKDEHLYLYFSPRAKKNYYENCLLSVFSSFLDQPL